MRKKNLNLFFSLRAGLGREELNVNNSPVIYILVHIGSWQRLPNYHMKELFCKLFLTENIPACALNPRVPCSIPVTSYAQR